MKPQQQKFHRTKQSATSASISIGSRITYTHGSRSATAHRQRRSDTHVRLPMHLPQGRQLNL
jgi:hypothetical protein